MIQLPEFFIALGCEEIKAPHLVIQTAAPHWIGKVVQFKNADDFAEFKANRENHRKFYPCAGYRIGIVIVGNIQHEQTQVPVVGFAPGMNMAYYFLNNKILPNHGYYKKYKIDY